MKLPNTVRPDLVSGMESHTRYHEPWLEGSRLLATNGKALVSIPVEREEGDVDGIVPGDALAAARKSKLLRNVGMMRIELNGSAIVTSEAGGPRTEFPRPPGGMAKGMVDSVIQDAKAGKRLAIILDATYLRALQDAMGCDALELSIDMEGEDGKNDGHPVLVTPEWHKGISARNRHIAKAEGAFGIIMPIVPTTKQEPKA